MVRFETPPGQQAQVDWAELGKHQLDGREVALHLFVMVLGFSRTLYAEAVTAEDLPTFLSCHARAFAFFGGMPAEVLYDNAKVVVLSRARFVISERLTPIPPEAEQFRGRRRRSSPVCR